MAGLAPSGEAWMLKAGGATGSTWPGKPRQGQAGPQGQDGRAGPGGRGRACGVSTAHSQAADGTRPPRARKPLRCRRPLSPTPHAAQKGRGRCQASESAGTDCWGCQLQRPGDPGSCVTTPRPRWKNGQGQQAAAPSPATSLGPPAAGGQRRSRGRLVASGTRKEAQVSLAR